MDEGVRYAVVETLLRQADEAAARGSLVDHFVDDKEDSLRIRIRIAEGFAELGWNVGDRRVEVEKRLPDAFQIDPRSERAKDPTQPPSARIKKK
jgi:hypothetical protein